jgi:hypothetical protein
MRRFLLAAMVASLVNPGAAGAQSGGRAVEMIGVGTRVQVGVLEGTPRTLFARPAQTLRGSVRAIAPETLYLDLPSAIRTVAVPREAIVQVRMSLGPPSRGASAMEVGVTAAAIFALLMPDFVAHPEQRFGSSFGAGAVRAGIGFSAGALFGLLRPYERWRTAWIPE